MKRITNIRSYVEEKDKLLDMSRELSVIQKRNVSCPEVIRRITNIPNLKEVLKEDALAKRYKR